jgi:hypothetical protein
MVLVAAALAVSSFGCGTVANFTSGHPEPFGGVQRDVAFFNQPSGFSFKSGDDGWGAAVVLGVWAADLCVSGMADTLTLPLFVYWERKREREEKADDQKVDDQEVDDQPAFNFNVPGLGVADNPMTEASPAFDQRGEPIEPNAEGESKLLWLPSEDPPWLHPPGAGPSIYPGLPLPGIHLDYSPYY